jgi:hypothetical protein
MDNPKKPAQDEENKNTTQYVLDTTICVGHHYMQTNTHNVKKKIG